MARFRKLAQQWADASQKARFSILKRSLEENTPPFEELRLAIIAAEISRGEVEEGQPRS